ncbi:hypothetical protein MMC22_005610 [Lobaria immixta]|nr:hypothetical protein [Lobaria immixta]
MAVFLDLDLENNNHNDDGDDRNNSYGNGTFRLPHNLPLLPLLPQQESPSSFPLPTSHTSCSSQLGPQPQTSHQLEQTNDGVKDDGSVRMNPNVNGFSAAVACYP